MCIAEKANSDSDETYLNSLVKKFIEKFSDFDSFLVDDDDEIFKHILIFSYAKLKNVFQNVNLTFGRFASSTETSPPR